MEAGLTWTIAKNRRDKCSFLGGEVCRMHPVGLAPACVLFPPSPDVVCPRFSAL